jgi:hypothetical protein
VAYGVTRRDSGAQLPDSESCVGGSVTETSPGNYACQGDLWKFAEIVFSDIRVIIFGTGRWRYIVQTVGPGRKNTTIELTPVQIISLTDIFPNISRDF